MRFSVSLSFSMHLYNKNLKFIFKLKNIYKYGIQHVLKYAYIIEWLNQANKCALYLTSLAFFCSENT